MKFSLFTFLILFSLGAQAAGKSAFINTQELLQKSPQAIAATTALQQQFGEREQSLRKMAQSIQQMEETYRNDSAIMSEEQKQKAQDNIIQNKRRFQFEQQSLQEDLQSKRRDLLREVESEIRTVIRAYGAENGYDFIFTEVSVAFASDSVDITDEILLELQKQ
jgi:outer membrane protein